MNPGDDFTPDARRQASQCDRLLTALKRAPVTTAEARAMLGLSSSPAARVLTLRRAGHRITTVPAFIGGAKVACYVLGEATDHPPTAEECRP